MCSVLLLIISVPSLWPLPLGGLSRSRGLDPLPESCGLAPLQEHLPSLVRHGASGRPVQCRRHGPVRLRHPALRLRGAWLGGRAVEKGSQRGGNLERNRSVGNDDGRLAEPRARKEK